MKCKSSMAHKPIMQNDRVYCVILSIKELLENVLEQQKTNIVKMYNCLLIQTDTNETYDLL